MRCCLALSLSLASCALSPDERTDLAMQLWAERSGVVRDRVKSMERAHARARMIDEVPAFSLGGRPPLTTETPGNTVVRRSDELPLPEHAQQILGGDGWKLPQRRHDLERDVGLAIREIQQTRYLAVLRPVAENRGLWDTNRRHDVFFVEGEFRGELLVFDLEEDQLLGKLDLNVNHSALLEGLYSHAKADIERHGMENAKALLQYVSQRR